MRGRAGQHFWWVAPTYGVAGSVGFDRLKRWLSEGLALNLWKANESEQSIILPNGTTLWFKGGDNPDSLYGQDVAAAVMDEATRCKPEAWYAVRSTLTATRGPVKIIGNVRGKKNWAYLLARRAQAGEQGMAYFKLTAWDAVEGGVLDAAEVEDAQRNLPADVFKQLYLAEPADDGGNPFGIDAIAACVSDLSTQPPAAFGVDLGKAVDWTVLCGLDRDGSTCRLDRWKSDWDQTRRKLHAGIANVPALLDSTGVGDPIVEDVRRVCPRSEGFKFTAQSKQQLMEGLAAAIQQQEISFPDGWLRQELDTFEFEYRQGGIRYSAPEGLHDDGVCALALAVRKLKRRQMTAIRVVGAPPVTISA